MKICIAILVGLTSAATISAQAQETLTFDWSIAYEGSGTFTTQNSGTTSNLVTGITGTFTEVGGGGPNYGDVFSIIGLVPAQGFEENDNMLYLTHPYVERNVVNQHGLQSGGIAFQLSNGVDCIIMPYQSGIEVYSTDQYMTYTTDWSVTEVTPTPEPSTLALGVVGIVAFIAARRRSQKQPLT